LAAEPWRYVGHYWTTTAKNSAADHAADPYYPD
jgi:hypothetical protein